MIALILSNRRSEPPFQVFQTAPCTPSKINHETRNHEQRQLSKGPCIRSQIFSPSFHKTAIPIIFQKEVFLDISPLEAGNPAMSTCHIVYFNKTGFASPLPSPAWQCIIIHISKRCWTEFSLSKMSRFVFVIREHSWSTPEALGLIQMEQVTYT